MLSKKYRLTNKNAFSATYNNKNIISNENLLLYVGKRKIDKSYNTRYGFVVSKKIHKRAVKRNRVKRLMREAVRLMLKNSQIPASNDFISFIFIAKDNALNCNFSEMQESILNLLEKAIKKF